MLAAIPAVLAATAAAAIAWVSLAMTGYTGALASMLALPAEALSTNSSAVTAIANDYGYDRVFARQIEAFARPGDVVVGITTSGNSRNVVLGLEEARRQGATTIAFTGNGGGKVAEIADIALIGPDGYSALVQEVHITLGHIVCDLVEQALA